MIQCSFCPAEFDPEDTPGAIFLSSPDTIENGSTIEKYHICPSCEQDILEEHTNFSNTTEASS